MAKKISVIGCGYVGFPLLTSFFEAGLNAVGFDVNMDSHFVSAIALRGIPVSNDPSILDKSDVFIICVPTPIDGNRLPDLTYCIEACKTVSRFLDYGSLVVFESTVFPGASRQRFIPELEVGSKLKASKDFFVGYSPERINPGDSEHSLKNVAKLVAGCCGKSLQMVEDLYSKIMPEELVVPVSSLEVAESAKVLENIQRDVNIALVNEFQLLAKRMDISAREVINAAATKWNFYPVHPGLVGGHCISVDPYYLKLLADELEVEVPVLDAARRVNEGMVSRVFNEIFHWLKNSPCFGKIYFVGIAFKPNVSDTRNSKYFEVLHKLGIQVERTIYVVDSCINKKIKFQGRYILQRLTHIVIDSSDRVILGCPHDTHSEEILQLVSDGVVGRDNVFSIHKIEGLNCESFFE